MANISDMDAVELAARIAQGDVSPVEAVSAAIEACERLNPVLNVLCSQRFDRALDDARAIKPGSAPFAEVPTLIKDLGTPEAGESSYMGNRVLKALGVKSPIDAHIVTKMKAAGLKPSRGRISWGPMPGDPYSLPQPVRRFSDEMGQAPGRLRIGVCRVNKLGDLHPDCVAAVDAVASQLEGEGHYVEEAYPKNQFDEPGCAGYF